MHALTNVVGTFAFLLIVPACILAPVAVLAARTRFRAWLNREPFRLDSDLHRYGK